MGKDHKSAAARAIAKYAAETHRRSSAAYRSRNVDDLREKARVRMAAHRQRLKQHDLDWEKQKERARASDKKYHERHAEHLAHKQRLRRQSAYIAKYGEQAYIERGVQEELARREKATAVTQEIAAEGERDQRRQAMMDWAGDWVAKRGGNSLRAAHNRSVVLDVVNRSVVLDVVGSSHSML
ncbi:hypothetical protein K438DRAFT_1942840 [Mycena galopus ATCC 62051]|nr:hypothetical protein K438DRAFT_1942840 [Mycena galopus ATCC 62051]